MSPANTSPTPIHHKLVFAGFGGQGVLRMGQVLAEAAVLEGREVVWTPAYGPEMRGGPAFCTVILSSTPIGAPIVAEADTAIFLDQPSLVKYQAQVRPTGAILLNSSLIDTTLARQDIPCYAVPGNHIAEEVGESRIVNMVMLGALLHLFPLVSTDAVIQALRLSLPERRRYLIPMNEQALSRGAAAIAEGTPPLAPR